MLLEKFKLTLNCPHNIIYRDTVSIIDRFLKQLYRSFSKTFGPETRMLEKAHMYKIITQ